MVRMSIEKIIHFKNSVSVQLEAKDKHSYHLSHSQIVHKHKETSQMKIGCGHSQALRVSHEHTEQTYTISSLISCLGFDY